MTYKIKVRICYPERIYYYILDNEFDHETEAYDFLEILKHMPEYLWVEGGLVQISPDFNGHLEFKVMSATQLVNESDDVPF